MKLFRMKSEIGDDDDDDKKTGYGLCMNMCEASSRRYNGRTTNKNG